MTQIIFPEVGELLHEEMLRLIPLGREAIHEIAMKVDWANIESRKAGWAKMNATKGGYSRKLKQFLKRVFVVEFVRLNCLAKTYSNYNNICEAFFDEAFDHSLVAGLQKSKRWGTRQPPVQRVFGEKVFDATKEYLNMLFLFEKNHLLVSLTYLHEDRVFRSVVAKSVVASSKGGPKKI